MNNTDYAFAVGTVRSLENGLINSTLLNQVIDSADLSDALRVLSDSGYGVFSGSKDYDSLIKMSTVAVFDEVKEIIGDTSSLNFLIVKNDFHNLKTVLKSLVSENNNNDAYKNLIYPSVFDGDELFRAVSSKEFEVLPKFIRPYAEKGYEIITATLDGQQLDIYLDKASLSSSLAFADNSNSALAKEFANAFVNITNIKIALRFAGKKSGFSLLDDALCPDSTIDTEDLANAAKSGISDLLSFIEIGDYPSLADAYRKSAVEFERACDNILTEIMRKASLISFGPEPVFAYYYAKLLEAQALRIVLCCKDCEMPPELIRERVRALYV